MRLKYTLYNRTLECYLKLGELEKKNAISPGIDPMFSAIFFTFLCLKFLL